MSKNNKGNPLNIQRRAEARLSRKEAKRIANRSIPLHKKRTNMQGHDNIVFSGKDMQPQQLDPTFTILVKDGRNLVDGLRIIDVYDPLQKDWQAYRNGTNEKPLVAKDDAFVVFETKQGKKWKIHLNEFSFYIGKKAA